MRMVSAAKGTRRGSPSAALLATSLMMAACSSDSPYVNSRVQTAVDDVVIPRVAGNTFDYWNQLDKISPEAAVININYEYLFDQQAKYALPGVFKADSWIFADRDKTALRKLLFISVKRESPDVEDPSGRVLVFGRHQFVSEAFCIDGRDSDIPPLLDPYLKGIWSGYPVMGGGPFLAHRFVARDKEKDGARLELLHVQTIKSLGYSCSDIGNLDEPAEEFTGQLEKLYTTAQRSFDVIG